MEVDRVRKRESQGQVEEKRTRTEAWQYLGAEYRLTV
jgi:hypothetical protein